MAEAVAEGGHHDGRSGKGASQTAVDDIAMQKIYFDDTYGQNTWIDFRMENQHGDVMPATISTCGNRVISQGRDYHKIPDDFFRSIGRNFQILQYTQRGSLKFIQTLPGGEKREHDAGPEQCVFINGTGNFEFHNPGQCFYSFIYIGFRGPLAEHVFTRILEKGPVHRLERDGGIVAQFHELFRRALQSGLAFTQLRKLATCMLLDLESQLCDRDDTQDGDFPRQLADWVNEYMAEATVKGMAAQCDMSTKYFQTYFRRKYGITPGRFILDMRINFVKRLLECTKMKLDSIADAAGFSDSSHLCRVFRQQTGSTPQAFRERKIN